MRLVLILFVGRAMRQKLPRRESQTASHGIPLAWRCTCCAYEPELSCRDINRKPLDRASRYLTQSRGERNRAGIVAEYYIPHIPSHSLSHNVPCPLSSSERRSTSRNGFPERWTYRKLVNEPFFVLWSFRIASSN